MDVARRFEARQAGKGCGDPLRLTSIGGMFGTRDCNAMKASYVK